MVFPWDKEDRKPTSNSINLFFLSYEEVEENKNGVKREILLEPWYEVAYHLLRYITCEGRISMPYAYHFRFLHQLKNFLHEKPEENISIPYFLLQSLREMRTKVKKGKEEELFHHGLIKLIICDALTR